MKRMVCLVALLSLAALACASLPLPGGEPTTVPGHIETSVAGTLTALAPVPGATETPASPAASDTPAAGSPSETPGAAATATTAPAGPTCAVSYADGSNLYCLGEGDAVTILATAPPLTEIADPAISPDGQLVAYMVGLQGEPRELWVVGADPTLNPPRILVETADVPSPNPANEWYPRRFAWRAGTRTLFFDTRWQPVGGVQGPGEYVNSDLWLADADSPTIAAILGEGLGGNWAASPDGSYVAFSYATGVGLVSADGSTLRRDVVTFPSIITYSEYQFKPDLFWQADSLAFNLAVPSADPMAPDPSASLYRVSTDGVVQGLATVPGNFVFGGNIRPAFSPTGAFAVYSQIQSGSSQTEDVHLLRLSGDVPSDTIVDTRDLVIGGGWSPNGDHFAYASTPGSVPGSGYDLGLEGPIQPWAPGLTQLVRLEWRDPTTFYFIGTINNAAFGLYRQTLGAEPVLLASGLPSQAGLDVRLAP
jgi:hypothetical protein